MNPELIRNLRLELSWARVLAPVGVLLLILLALGKAEGEPIAATIGMALFCLWGARGQSEAVAGEITDRTWDDQRLCGLSPWSLVWGKFLGASAPAWIGLLSAVIVGSIWATQPLVAVKTLLSALVTATLVMAIGLLASCVTPRLTLASGRRAGVGAFGVVLIGCVAAGLLMMAGVRSEPVLWFGLTFSAWTFVQLVGLSFAAFALWGAERCLRVELRVACRPLAWPAFLLFVALLSAGFAPTVMAGLWAGGMAALGPCYVAMMLAPKDPIAVGRWADDFTAGRPFADPPLWASAGAGAVIAAFLAYFGSGLWWGGTSGSAPPGPLLLLAFALRDAAIVHIFALSLRRGHALGLFCIVALHGLAAWLLSGQAVAAFTVLGFPAEGGGVEALLAAMIQAAAALFGAAHFWRRSMRADR